MSRNVDFLYKDLEVPQVVLESVDDALGMIERDEVILSEETKGNISRGLIRAAVLLAVCFVGVGTPVVAKKVMSLYYMYMESMTEEERDEAYDITDAAETNLFSRPLSEQESTRYANLNQKYLEEGVFPKEQLRKLAEGEVYDSGGIALDPTKRLFYLPDRELTDEELLQIIDIDQKGAYAAEQRVQANYRAENPWLERMEALTDKEVDRMYLLAFSAPVDVFGYSRDYSEAEGASYNRLLEEYENNNLMCPDEIRVIALSQDFDNSTVAWCMSEGSFYLPGRELTEDELLQIIDFWHKSDYCINRIHDEVFYTKVRSEYPKLTVTMEEFVAQECR